MSVTELLAYLPQDRQRALLQGAAVSTGQTHGCALFADISGFTPLTEALTQSLGLRRGAEELPHHLNRVYTALIAEVDRQQGSVISFAGDAITCWFDDSQGEASHRAFACALAMQAAMTQFAHLTFGDGSQVALSIKIGIAMGPAQRFLAGDPDIQLVDIIAGATLGRTALAEHQAQTGEVVIDTPTAEALAPLVEIAEWRTDPETGHRFAKVYHTPSLPGAPASVSQALPERAPGMHVLPASVRPWMLSTVFDRLHNGLGHWSQVKGKSWSSRTAWCRSDFARPRG